MNLYTVHFVFIQWVCVCLDLILTAANVNAFPQASGIIHRQRLNDFGFARISPYKRSARSHREITYSTLSSDEGKAAAAPTVTGILEFIDRIRHGFLPHCPENNTDPPVTPMTHYRFSPEHFFKPFKKEVQRAVDLANTLNDYFMYKDDGKRLYNDIILFALTQSLVELEPSVIGCGIAFDKGQYPARNETLFFPYSYKLGSLSDSVIVSDLTLMYAYYDTEWFKSQKFKPTSHFRRSRGFVFANASDVGDTRKYDFWRNSSIVVSARDGFWADPYYDCKMKKLIVQFSVPFYQLKKDKPHFKGVVLADINLLDLEINQCAKDSSLFANSNRCRPETTECVHIPGNGLAWGSYQCRCNPTFYFPVSHTTNDRYFDGKLVERAYWDMWRNVSDNFTDNYTNMFQCLPCRKGCDDCTEDDPCIVEYDVLLRGIPLGIQSFCMTITLVLAVVVIRLRKTKVMRSSMWILLEMILLGALLLYATIVIQYFEPTTITCILVPWFREVGFSIVYGALVLKIYRILSEFQSRKAHRVLVRDKDLLKYLAVIVIVVMAYMAAWTAVNMDHFAEGAQLVDIGMTRERLKYILCKSHWWDYVIELSEFLFLSFGVYLCYCVRAAPSEYSEGKYISAAICYEAFVSTVFYILKHLWWFSLHPDYLFLMYFLRCQLTITVILLLILGPKLWYAHRPLDEDNMRSRAYSQSDVQENAAPETMKLNVGISSNGDVDVGEISLAEMDPEDIRAELKRLYTQLQIYKTKTMRKDNPHISKRRGGRKQTHRRFSLQAFHHKHRHHPEAHSEHEHEMSKTPEESTNSAEAMALPMESSSRGDDGHEPRSAPSVSFKPGSYK
ncbi:probable G-protein coupled receptor 158 [Gigantopelta aegis]|uniref:probable G-protein coupled receptor 158 n=1 Tax=Gigantopelta aegis TaxID=1735272 RepID=UPI001B888614|nr:probable G-protein coupled receptor 158 [Gigantopelta aegis]